MLGPPRDNAQHILNCPALSMAVRERAASGAAEGSIPLIERRLVNFATGCFWSAEKDSFGHQVIWLATSVTNFDRGKVNHRNS